MKTQQLHPTGLLALLALAGLAVSQSARAQLYVGQNGNNWVGEYNTTTGAAINPSFITTGGRGQL